MRRVAAIIAFGLTASGCDPAMPPPKVGVKNWMPNGVGGPIELRPLPPAYRINAEWETWLESDPSKKARVYEAVLKGASNQISFEVEVRRGETPLGRPEHTYVSFLYNDPTNGTYKFVWDRLGRHTGDYLRLGDQPQRVWVQWNSVASPSGIPLLQIEAFEGLESDRVIIAEPGRKSLSPRKPSASQ